MKRESETVFAQQPFLHVVFQRLVLQSASCFKGNIFSKIFRGHTKKTQTMRKQLALSVSNSFHLLYCVVYSVYYFDDQELEMFLQASTSALVKTIFPSSRTYGDISFIFYDLK